MPRGASALDDAARDDAVDARDGADVRLRADDGGAEEPSEQRAHAADTRVKRQPGGTVAR